LLLICFSLFSFRVIAAQYIECPSIEEIKLGHFHSWLPLYVDQEELASDADVALFIKDVESLEVAQWNPAYLESAHCFYDGKQLAKKIVFAHDAWRPLLPGKWRVKDKFAECFSKNKIDCGFIL